VYCRHRVLPLSMWALTRFSMPNYIIRYASRYFRARLAAAGTALLAPSRSLSWLISGALVCYIYRVPRRRYIVTSNIGTVMAAILLEFESVARSHRRHQLAYQGNRYNYLLPLALPSSICRTVPCISLYLVIFSPLRYICS
jgi:hypothetical protein